MLREGERALGAAAADQRGPSTSAAGRGAEDLATVIATLDYLAGIRS